MKRTLSMLLAAVMIISLFSVSAFAADETHKITLTSKQGLFKDVSAEFKPGEVFSIKLELKTNSQLSDATFSLTYDKSQIRIGSLSSPLSLPDPITNETGDGEYILVVATGSRLIDTTAGGEFATFKGKAQDGFNSDQTITVDAQTLRGGRYNDNGIVDISFEELYVAWSKVENTNFTLAASFPGKESVEPPTQSPASRPAETTQPTAKPTEKPTEPTTVTTLPTETSSATNATDLTNPGGKLIYGDADLNELINIKDATLIQQHLAKLKTLSGDALAVSDVDGSGDVNIKDATCIQKFLAKLDGGAKVNQPYN